MSELSRQERQMDLVKPTPNPFIDRGYEHSMYLYYIAYRMDQILNALQNQCDGEVSTDRPSAQIEEGNSIEKHAE